MHRLILALYCAFLFFYGLGVGELYRNETLRAIIARDMLRSGNWIVPTLYGEPLFTKPPGMYIAIALCSWPFGDVTEWTARLPSALAATFTVWLTYWFFSRRLDRQAGFIAALILPMSVFWLERGTSAEIDMLQVAWVTASIYFLLEALAGDSTANGAVVDGRWLALALVCVAGGTLTKWTAPAFFYGTAIPFLWWRGRLRVLWSWQHLVAAGLAAALVLTWIGAAVAQTSWDAFYGTVSREALQHLAPGQGRRAFPWQDMVLHPFKVLAATLPWSAVGLVALWPAFVRRWDERGRFLLQALHCWAWPSLLFWSLASEHSLRHSAPVFPALAGLATMVCLGWSRGFLTWHLSILRPGHVFTGALAIWMGVKAVFVEEIMPRRLSHRHAQRQAAELDALVPHEQVLYVLKLKDEGIMFYFGRTVQRLADPSRLPSGAFCIMTLAEWQHWPDDRSAEVVGQLCDAQGDDIVLVRVQ